MPVPAWHHGCVFLIQDVITYTFFIVFPSLSPLSSSVVVVAFVGCVGCAVCGVLILIVSFVCGCCVSWCGVVGSDIVQNAQELVAAVGCCFHCFHIKGSSNCCCLFVAVSHCHQQMHRVILRRAFVASFATWLVQITVVS